MSINTYKKLQYFENNNENNDENNNILDIYFYDYINFLTVEFKNEIATKINAKYKLHSLDQYYNDDIDNIYDIIQYFFGKDEKKYMFYLVNFKKVLEEKLSELGNISIDFYNKTNSNYIRIKNLTYNEFLYSYVKIQKEKFLNIINIIVKTCESYVNHNKKILEKLKYYQNLIIINNDVTTFKIIYGFKNSLLFNLIDRCDTNALYDKEFNNMLKDYNIADFLNGIHIVIYSEWFKYNDVFKKSTFQMNEFKNKIKLNKDFNNNPYIMLNNNFIQSLFVIDFILSYYSNIIKN
jgi:hypothetical protein